MAKSDLERAFEALRAKGRLYSRYFGYYDGDQPLVYMTKRLEEIFKGVEAVFTENWCAVVIDSVEERINLKTILTPYEEEWAAIWEENRLKLEADDVQHNALVTGEGFVIAWPDEMGQPQAFSNDPRLCAAFYQEGNPREMSYAAKWWEEDDGTGRMTLYYPDRLEYYKTTKKLSEVSSAKSFTAREVPAADNPFGEVPVFHFRTAGRKAKSDLANVINLQNAINKLGTDMLVAAEYGAFKQRFIISNSETGGKLKNAPNEIWEIPAGDGMSQQTQVGQLEATGLDNYLKAMDNLAMSVSSITRTPKHYFFSIGSNISGEALIAMEAPLNKKAQDRIDSFTPTWQSLTRFMLMIAGLEVNERDVQPAYDEPESVQPYTEAQTLQVLVAAGVPLMVAAKRLGWSQAAVDALGAAVQDQQAAQQTTLATGLLESMRKFNTGA